MEKIGETREQRKPRAWAMFDTPSHESEYMLVADTESFPPEVEAGLQRELGENWQVLNRYIRIEIKSKNHTARKMTTKYNYEFKQN